MEIILGIDITQIQLLYLASYVKLQGVAMMFILIDVLRLDVISNVCQCYSCVYPGRPGGQWVGSPEM